MCYTMYYTYTCRIYLDIYLDFASEIHYFRYRGSEPGKNRLEHIDSLSEVNFEELKGMVHLSVSAITCIKVQISYVGIKCHILALWSLSKANLSKSL